MPVWQAEVVGKHKVDASARSSAPPERVWELLGDTSTYPDWGTWDATEIERHGEPPPDGLGAIRKLTTGRYVVREEITAFEPPRLFGYHLIDGLPMRNYDATVELTPDGDGTLIRWRSEFDSKIPGTGALIRRRMQGLFEEVARLLADAAAKH